MKEISNKLIGELEFGLGKARSKGISKGKKSGLCDGDGDRNPSPSELLKLV